MDSKETERLTTIKQLSGRNKKIKKDRSEKISDWLMLIKAARGNQ